MDGLFVAPIQRKGFGLPLREGVVDDRQPVQFVVAARLLVATPSPT